MRDSRARPAGAAGRCTAPSGRSPARPGARDEAAPGRRPAGRSVAARGRGQGAFGENLTTERLLEDEVRIGDALRVGSAVLEVTQPRTPCGKLAMRLQRPTLVREFKESRRCGFYCSVRLEGDVAAGDAIVWVERAPAMPTVTELFVRS